MMPWRVGKVGHSLDHRLEQVAVHAPLVVGVQLYRRLLPRHAAEARLWNAEPLGQRPNVPMQVATFAAVQDDIFYHWPFAAEHAHDLLDHLAAVVLVVARWLRAERP